MSPVGTGGRVSIAAVIRGTARGYAREPGLIVAATVAIVLLLWLLKLPPLSGPLPSLVAAIVSFCAVSSFIAFVLTAIGEQSPKHTEEAERGLAIAQRARGVVGELALLLLVMGIAVAILSGVLDLVVLFATLSVVLNAKSHGGLLFDLPAAIAAMTVPLLVLLTAWSVALPVAVHEQPGGILPLGRSYELVRGNRLRAFVVVVLLAAIVVIANVGLAALVGPSEFEGSRISGMIAALLIAPMPLLAMNALYIELASCSSSQRLRSSPPP